MRILIVRMSFVALGVRGAGTVRDVNHEGATAEEVLKVVPLLYEG